LLKSSGLRWMCVALLVPVDWAARVWALPFLTALCPSERYGPYRERGRRHKPLPERARGLLGQVRRWLPQRTLIVVADSSYAALELLAWCARHTITVITRLRLDAALYGPAPARRPGQPGRRRLKGKRVRKLTERLKDGRTRWRTVQLAWYGGPERRLQLATGTAVWYKSGKPPVAIRSRAGARSEGPLRAHRLTVDRSEVRARLEINVSHRKSFGIHLSR
jgi:hypothetical protein